MFGEGRMPKAQRRDGLKLHSYNLSVAYNFTGVNLS